MKKWAMPLALLALVAVLAVPALAAKGGKAATGGVVSVPDAAYGSTVTATANPGGADVYVYVQCYTPDIDGKYVYAAFFPVVNGQATVGPLAATTWPNSDAGCTAQEGSFARDGWGKWNPVASTTFHVSAT